jgi:hypothetical protein
MHLTQDGRVSLFVCLYADCIPCRFPQGVISQSGQTLTQRDSPKKQIVSSLPLAKKRPLTFSELPLIMLPIYRN